LVAAVDVVEFAERLVFGVAGAVCAGWLFAVAEAVEHECFGFGAKRDRFGAEPPGVGDEPGVVLAVGDRPSVFPFGVRGLGEPGTGGLLVGSVGLADEFGEFAVRACVAVEFGQVRDIDPLVGGWFAGGFADADGGGDERETAAVAVWVACFDVDAGEYAVAGADTH
jgi:hypothetical protein